MNHKYTLCCIPGRLFRPGMHFFILDDWITDPSLLILSHGIMSEQEYNSVLSQNRIIIYQCIGCSWIGIYPMHESKKYKDTQFAGYLHRTKSNVWKGVIHVG